MLETTLLETVSFADFEIRKFEALKFSNRSAVRRLSLLDEIPKFVDPNVQQFWKLYDDVNPSFKINFPEAERDERRRFMRCPFYVAVREFAVGGLWVDPDDKVAHMHVIVEPSMRGKGVGSALLSKFEKDAQGKYEILSCGWEADRHTSASKLFMRAGYGVVLRPYAGNAKKSLSVR